MKKKLMDNICIYFTLTVQFWKDKKEWDMSYFVHLIIKLPSYLILLSYGISRKENSIIIL